MFTPRNPVVQNQFCSYAAQTDDATGVGGVLCYAGAVLYLDASAANEEAIVKKMTYSVTPGFTPFGFSMQKVKSGYHQVHPAGFSMPGDLGSSDVIAQPSYSSGAINGTKEAPLGVAHLGLWDTVHYTTASVKMAPGDALYASNDEAKVSNDAVYAADVNDLTGAISTTVVGRVMKGASAAKCAANIANTTLYPIRIKLLV